MPEWYPRPGNASGREEDMLCAICSHEWLVWVRAGERTAECPACGYQNSLGEP